MAQEMKSSSVLPVGSAACAVPLKDGAKGSRGFAIGMLVIQGKRPALPVGLSPPVAALVTAMWHQVHGCSHRGVGAVPRGQRVSRWAVDVHCACVLRHRIRGSARARAMLLPCWTTSS